MDESESGLGFDRPLLRQVQEILVYQLLRGDPVGPQLLGHQWDRLLPDEKTRLVCTSMSNSSA